MAPLKRDASATKKASSRSRVGFYQIVNDYLGFFRDSNSQLFGDYSIYLLGINDFLDDYLGSLFSRKDKIPFN